MTKSATLTDEGRRLIADAVSAAEGKSAGEVVTIVAARSDSYADVALVWSAAIALLALVVLASATEFYLALWERITNGWASEWSPRDIFTISAVVATLKFCGTWLILLWRPLRLWLTPAWIKHHRVRDRAITLFKVGAERRTTGRTGILIYLSLEERRAEIVADEAISAKVDPRVWGDAMAPMLLHLRDGRMAEGMVEAVNRVGAVLAEHFPHSEDDTDELPEAVIEV
jgi:putative membrane protein